MNSLLLHLLAAPSAQAAEGATFWLPPQASTYAGDTDFVFYFIYWTCVFFFIVMMGAVGYFVLSYRQKSEGEKVPDIKGSHALELGWATVPGVFLVAMFYLGFEGWVNQAVPPKDAYEIRVTAQKWNWSFTYLKDGKAVTKGGQDSECMKAVDSPRRDVECNEPLRIPAGKPVKLVMNSIDVLHSFYVPDFRIKKDVVPGRYTVVWFEAPEVGPHDIFCTEYCGDKHGYMYSRVEVLEPAKFDAWLKEEADKLGEGGLPPAKEFFAQKGCPACHSVDGANGVGPTLKGKYGTMEKLADGSEVKIDDEYLRESILNPTAKIVAGYPPAMPSFQGQLKEAEVNHLIDYIKTLAE